MTNQAISAILDELCNKAGNAANVTQGLLRLLREVANIEKETCDGIGTDTADQMLQLIDDLRELLSVGERRSASRFDFAVLIRDIVEALNLGPQGSHLRLKLAGAQKALLVTQDPVVVERACTRLIDVLRGPKPPGEIFVGGDTDTVFLNISPGAPEVLARIPEWLADTPDTATFQGPFDVPIGIAVMAAAKQIRGLGGEIRLNGCEVVIVLPASPSPDVVIDGSGNPDCLNVLVVEDCDESYALTSLLLRTEAVRRASDGIEAVEMVRRQRFDLVFMDVHMDCMNGYAAIQAIRDWETETGNARTPIVILSSDDLKTQKRSAARAGCAGYLRKPLRRSDLADILSRLRSIKTLTSPVME